MTAFTLINCFKRCLTCLNLLFRWIYTAEQVESQITLAKLRPYYPSFMWKPVDPTPTRLLDLLEAEAKEGDKPPGRQVFAKK